MCVGVVGVLGAWVCVHVRACARACVCGRCVGVLMCARVLGVCEWVCARTPTCVRPVCRFETFEYYKTVDMSTSPLGVTTLPCNIRLNHGSKYDPSQEGRAIVPDLAGPVAVLNGANEVISVVNVSDLLAQAQHKVPPPSEIGECFSENRFGSNGWLAAPSRCDLPGQRRHDRCNMGSWSPQLLEVAKGRGRRL